MRERNWRGSGRGALQIGQLCQPYLYANTIQSPGGPGGIGIRVAVGAGKDTVSLVAGGPG